MKIYVSIPDELVSALNQYKDSGRSPDVLIARLLTAHFTGGSCEPDISGADTSIKLSILEADLDRLKDKLSQIMKECADLGIEIRRRS